MHRLVSFQRFRVSWPEFHHCRHFGQVCEAAVIQERQDLITTRVRGLATQFNMKQHQCQNWASSEHDCPLVELPAVAMDDETGVCRVKWS